MKIRIPQLNVQPRLTWHFSVKPQAKDNSIIVMVHNFAGTEDNFPKHIQLLNDMGYDVVTFDLSWHKHGGPKLFTNFVRREWSKEVKQAITEVLKERSVIAFGFSGPSFCVIDAVSDIVQKNPEAIKGMIFDSGPFEHHAECVKNMLELHFKIKSKIMLKAILTTLVLAWEPLPSETNKRKFGRLFKAKPRMPILSLQPRLDRVVPIEYIQECFEKAQPQNYTEVVFEKGGHLTSLKEEPDKYKEALQKFLFALG